MTLRRNRDFVLLQAGQLLSSTGSSFTGVAYPLLALSLTHSPAKAGLVSFARLLPSPLLGLVAGVAADRWPRRRIMLAADVLRALSLGTLAVVVAVEPVFWVVPVIALVEGTGDVFFGASSVGATRAVVPPAELPAAVGVQQARSASVGIAGPPIGGVLYGIGRAIPFAADAVSYAFSFLSLLAMRTPFQQERHRLDCRHPPTARRGFFLPLAAAVPAHDRVPLRRRELHHPRAALRARRRCAPRRSDARRHRRAPRLVQRLPADRVAPLAARTPCLLGPGDHAGGVLRRPRHGRVRRAPERLRPRGGDAPAGVRPADHGFGGDRPTPRDDAGSSARTGRGGADDDRPHGPAARAVGRRVAARRTSRAGRRWRCSPASRPPSRSAARRAALCAHRPRSRKSPKRRRQRRRALRPRSASCRP